jgi:hypothetical protein
MDAWCGCVRLASSAGMAVCLMWNGMMTNQGSQHKRCACNASCLSGWVCRGPRSTSCPGHRKHAACQQYGVCPHVMRKPSAFTCTTWLCLLFSGHTGMTLPPAHVWSFVSSAGVRGHSQSSGAREHLGRAPPGQMATQQHRRSRQEPSALRWLHCQWAYLTSTGKIPAPIIHALSVRLAHAPVGFACMVGCHRVLHHSSPNNYICTLCAQAAAPIGLKLLKVQKLVLPSAGVPGS